MLNHIDQNTTFSFEAEPGGVLNHLMAIVLSTLAEQLKHHIIWILNAQKLRGFTTFLKVLVLSPVRVCAAEYPALVSD